MAMTMGRCRMIWGFTFIIILGCLCTAYSKMILGGVEDVPNFQEDKEIKNLAKYAVQEHNKQQNSALTFAKVVKAQQQVVGGMKYYLTLEAMDGAQSRLYRAIIYERVWENFKQLLEFKPVKE